MAMTTRETVTEKYEEISRLETHGERREFLGKQSPEMKIALWLENIERKTRGKTLSAEQKEVLELIKQKFITVEFAESAGGKEESEAGAEYAEIMNRATRLLGEDNLREWFGIVGDSRTLKFAS